MPAYTGVVIAVVSFPAVAVEISSRREVRVLRRFRATPLHHPIVYIASDVVAYYIEMMPGICLLFLLAGTLYGMWADGKAVALVAGISLSAAALLPLGYVLVGLVSSARMATLVSNVLPEGVVLGS